MGAALAEELGLTEHHIAEGARIESKDTGIYVDGVAVEDCKSTDGAPFLTIQMTGHGTYYCPSAPTKLEAWLIGQRLIGHNPSDAEIEEMRQALEG